MPIVKQTINVLQSVLPKLYRNNTLIPDGFIHKVTDSGSPVKNKFSNINRKENVLQWYENCPSSNLKDILTNPDFYYPETNDDFTKITYGRKYDGVKKQDGFLAVTFDTGNLNAGLITIHQKKFNDKILKNKNLVWNTLLNSTNSEPLIGETVEKQSNEPNSILAQRNDLSTNNYDGIRANANFFLL